MATDRVSDWLAKEKISSTDPSRCSNESGWHPDALRKLSQSCKIDNKLRIYRQRKREAIRYEERSGYRPKPMDVKLKSQKSGEYAALVMIPEKLDALPADDRKELDALLANGYRREPTGKNDGWTYLVDPRGNRLYSDIDPMGAYRQVTSGGFVRAPESPSEMNLKLGRKIWDDSAMEKAWGGGAQDHYWKKGDQGTFEMRPDPTLKGKVDDATLMAMGATVRKMALSPRPDEKFLVATPAGGLYVVNLQQLRDIYKVGGMWWPY